MKPYLFRVVDGRMKLWILADWSGAVVGLDDETLNAVTRRYERMVRRPVEGYRRVVGTTNLVEAGLRLGLLWRDGKAEPVEGGAS